MKKTTVPFGTWVDIHLEAIVPKSTATTVSQTVASQAR